MNYTVSVPGRICLFGEHQDYLGLPVIAAAVSRWMRIDVALEDPSLCRYRVIMPDIEQEDLINTAMPLVYQHKKDYLRSTIKNLREAGAPLPKALTATVRSEIPIAAGSASSTAFCLGWAAALLFGAGREEALDPRAVADCAHRSEVVEFGESGGKMDHLSIAHGGLCAIDFADPEPVKPLPLRIDGFVLGDSLQPKNTQQVLSRVRRVAEAALAKVKACAPILDLRTAETKDLEKAAQAAALSEDEGRVWSANLENREILREARSMLREDRYDPQALGCLLSSHHAVLRDELGISTPRVVAMLEAALDAGALGGKINGSGGGGCLFVLAPGREKETARAMEEAGGRAWPVWISEGIRIGK